MKKLLFLLLFLVIFIFKFPSSSEAVLIGSENVLIPSRSVNVGYNLPPEIEVPIWSYTAKSPYVVSSGEINIELINDNSGSNRYVGIIIRFDGVTVYDETSPSDSNVTDAFRFNNCNVNTISIIGYRLGSYSGNPQRARVTSGTLTLAADVADNVTVQQAKIAADAAKTSADSAKNSASLAASRTWDSSEGKSAATLSKEARDKANTSANNTTYIRNTQLPGTENRLSNKIDNIETSLGSSISSTETSINSNISNLENKIALLEGNITEVINEMDKGDITPPNFVDLKTKSGARATSGSSIQLVVDATDNISSTLQYSVDGGPFQSLPANRIIIASVGSGPIATISVTVKDEAGNESSKSISIRKL